MKAALVDIARSLKWATERCQNRKEQGAPPQNELGFSINLLFILDDGLTLLFARSSLLLRRLPTSVTTLGLPLARHGLGWRRSHVHLSCWSSDGQAGLDVLDVVLQLFLELLDDLAAGVDIPAAWDGRLLSYLVSRRYWVTRTHTMSTHRDFRFER